MKNKIKSFINFYSKRITKLDKKKVVLVFVISLLVNVSSVLLPLLQKNIIDSINLKSPDIILLIIFFIISLFIALMAISESLFLNSLFMSAKNKIQVELLQSVTRTENNILKQRGPGGFMVSILGNSEQLAMLLNTNYFSLVFVTIAAIATLIISLRWSYVFVACILISYIVIFFIIKLSNKYYINNFKKGKDYVLEINPKLLEYIENRVSILNNCNVKKCENDLNNLFLKRDMYFRKAFASNALAETAISSVKTVALTVFFVLSMFSILNNKLQISAFIAMLSYFNLVFIPVKGIQQFVSSMSKFNNLKKRISENIDINYSSQLPVNFNINMKNCFFHHEDSNNLLSSLDLIIDKKIGLVGLSGEGKTTMIKLILGEHQAKEGSVILGGVNINCLSKILIYSMVRLYSQDSEIFNNDLKYNITLNRKELSSDNYDIKLLHVFQLIQHLFKQITKDNAISNISFEEQEVLNTLFNDLTDVASIINGIKNLQGNSLSSIRLLAKIVVNKNYYKKEMYDNIINSLELEYLADRDFGQRGKNISGGEKNKICLARFLLSDEDIPFIIDEPFTSLDSISEKNNLDVLKKYLGKRSGIIISHKINVIKELADEIIVLENNTITNRGNHENLLIESALYKKLNEQFLNNK